MTASTGRVGIMQPYFFPYLGHFALVAQTDHWMVFDITQYTPKTWMNRNAVLHPNGGRNWISVPLRNGGISIKTHEARILDVAAARRTVLGKLTHYKRHAPFYRDVITLVERAFAMPEADCSLVHLNVHGLVSVCDHLGLPFRYQICSEAQWDLPTDLGPGDWALHICRQIGATHYLNPAGGRHLFDPQAYREAGIEIEFLEMEPFRYATEPYVFEEGLSILDVLMWNDPAVVRQALRDCSRIV